jgi:HlyD family secretion protein
MIRSVQGLAAILALFAATACSDRGAEYTGYVEADYALVAAPQAGWLTNVAVDRGAAVKPGDALFSLDTDRETAQTAEAAERAASAAATARDLARGARAADLAPLEAQRVNAQALADLARAEEARWRPLLEKGFASQAKLDTVIAQRRSADAQLAQIDKSIAAAKLAARTDQLAAARANSAAAGAALTQAQWVKEQRQVDSRIKATVEDRLREPGEYVAAGAPILSLLPEGRIFVRFFAPVEDAATIKAGDVIDISCSGCANGLQGRIRFVSRESEFTPPVIFSEKAHQRLVFMIEAEPLNGAALRPGAPVQVRLAVKPKSA